MRLIVLTSVFLLAAFTVACAQDPDRFSGADARTVVTTLARQLEENFIYPEIGAAYAGVLRDRLAAGAYASFPSAAEFARAVTRDLQGVHREGHLRLIPPSETPATSPFADVPDAGKGVVKAGWVAPGVGYVSIHGFEGDRARYTELMDRLRAALDTLAGASTLIVDARHYVGGALEDTDVMASYFFVKPTPLLEFDTRLAVEERGGGVLEESARLVRVRSPAGIVRRRQVAIPAASGPALRDTRIFVLTSKRTASGGEGFALAMKVTKRATLIGETTAGAGHFGRTIPLGHGYRAFIPIGRPFDPATGKGWELVGVKPDVTTTAEGALDEALKRSGVDPASGRAAVDSLPRGAP